MSCGGLVQRIGLTADEPVSAPPPHVPLLYAARGVRGFGDGFAVIILPAYCRRSATAPFQIGIVATAALLGSSLLTLAVGFFAPRHDLRKLLHRSAPG